MRIRWWSVCAVSVVALLMVGATPVLASLSPPRSHPTRRSPLQLGLAYYAGKSVTFIAPVSTGGGGDLIARALAPQLGAYLHANVNVEDVPAGNTIAGQNQLAASPPNGLTVGELHLPTDILNLVTGSPGLVFDPASEDFLGGTLSPTGVFIASNTSNLTSIAAIKHSRTPPVFLTTGGGNLLQNTLLLNGAFGLRVRYISSYSNTGPLIQGFLRGDGPLTAQSMLQLAPLLEAGEARALLLTGPIVLPPQLKRALAHVPTLAGYEKQGFFKTRVQQEAVAAYNSLTALEEEFAAPRDTPVPELAALRAGFEFAVNSPAFRTFQIDDGEKPGFVAPVNTRNAFLVAMRSVPQMKKLFNGAGS